MTPHRAAASRRSPFPPSEYSPARNTALACFSPQPPSTFLDLHSQVTLLTFVLVFQLTKDKVPLFRQSLTHPPQVRERLAFVMCTLAFYPFSSAPLVEEVAAQWPGTDLGKGEDGREPEQTLPAVHRP